MKLGGYKQVMDKLKIEPMKDLNNFEKHFIVIGKDGEKLSLNGNKIDVDSEILNEKITKPIFENWLPNKNSSILLFIHGGLNEYKATIQKYSKQIPRILKDGHYPIFIIWRSGLIECYKEHLFKIRQGRIHKKYSWLTWIYYLISDIGRGLIRLPVTLYLQVINDFKPYMTKWNPDYRNSESIYNVLKLINTKNESIKVQWGNDLRSLNEKVIDILKYLITIPFKLISSIFIDSFGTSSWSNMLRRTRTLFRTSYEFDIRNFRESEDRILELLSNPPSGALHKFLNQLSNKINENTKEVDLTVIGHSMGTIVLNQIVEKFPNLPYDNLVYMAAACSITNFEKSLNCIKEKNKIPKIYNLCLNPIAETVESNAFDLAPRGSLLIWIDNFMSSPTVTPDRRLGVWENIMQTTQLIPKSMIKNTTLKCFDVGTRAKGPQKHGEFSSENFWQSTFWKTESQSITIDPM